MRIRTLCTVALVGAVAVGSAVPSDAKPKPRPKPISGTFTAMATPDPTSDTPSQAGGTMKCNPKTPTARVTHTFKVPAAGSLHVDVNNKLDWSADIRDASGVVTDSDGNLPTDAEKMDASFKKATTVTIGVCNDEGEPSLTVAYTFTYK